MKRVIKCFKAYLSRSLRLKGEDIETITARIHLLIAYDYEKEQVFKVFHEYGVRFTRGQVHELEK